MKAQQWLLSTVLVLGLLSGCQTKTILTTQEQTYLEKVDEPYAYEFATKLLDYKTNPDLGYRNAGSFAEHEAANMIAEEMKNIGLEDVLLEPFTVDSWTFEKADLSYVNENNEAVSVHLGGYATSMDTNGPKSFEIIDGKQGTKSDLEGLDVTGKFVLIDINQRTDWWINYPAYEAHIRGAAGVIAVQSGGYSEASDEALNSQDICGPSNAVAFSMSQKDAAALRIVLGSKSLSITLDAKSIVSENQTAYNVSGKIIGNNPNEYILVTSHYDVYYQGFQDNNAAVALSMGMAKGLIDAGIKPDKTIIFVSHAAEEWGATNTRYDWSTGAFNQINKLHPEWVGQAFVDINFELPAYQHSPSDEIRTVYEYVSYLDTWKTKVPKVEGAYPDGIKVTGGLRTWSDDYSYSLAGVPALRNDFDSGTFTSMFYHTQLDDPSTYQPEIMKYHLNMYGLMVLAYDQLAVMPFDFNARLDVYKEALPDYDFKVMKENAKAIYAKITDKNKAYIKALETNDQANITKLKEEAKALNQELIAAYLFAQDHFVRLTWEDVEIMPQTHFQTNVDALTSSIEALKNGEVTVALDEYLWLIDNNWYAYDFSNETYSYFTDYVLKQDPSRLFWGAGRIMDHVDLYDVINSLKSKSDGDDVSQEIQTLETILVDQQSKLDQTVESVSKDLDTLSTMLEALLVSMK